MRILWFNWRDIKNPDAGGAEVFTHEVMHRLVKKGYDVTLVTSRFPNSLAEETVDGAKIIRKGGKYTVYRKARKYYQASKKDFDLVIDEINTRPFFTPKFVTEIPVLAIVHSLAKEGWFYETRFPLSYIGYYYLELKWLSLYKDIPTVTVSTSSKQDLEAIGFGKVYLVTEGLGVAPLSELTEKDPDPTLIFIGRMKRNKLPHHAILAFSRIKDEIPNAKMWVIGDGYMLDRIKKIKIKDVTFYGHVTDELKYSLLKRSHLLLTPAVREGWGLVITEANAMGTPAVAYNVPGLRDSVKHGETGLLVTENSPQSLASSAISLLKDQKALRRLSRNALDFSKQFDWNNTASAFDTIIKQLITRK